MQRAGPMCFKCGKEERTNYRNSANTYCRTCLAAYHKKYYHTSVYNAELRHAYDRKKNHGITPEEYNLMLFQQGGVCAICGQPEMGIAPHSNGERRKALSIDHNHETGQIRGLLCTYCNQTLAYVEKDRSRARKILKYLQKHDT